LSLIVISRSQRLRHTGRLQNRLLTNRRGHTTPGQGEHQSEKKRERVFPNRLHDAAGLLLVILGSAAFSMVVASAYVLLPLCDPEARPAGPKVSGRASSRWRPSPVRRRPFWDDSKPPDSSPDYDPFESKNHGLHPLSSSIRSFVRTNHLSTSRRWRAVPRSACAS
jgi:hypothetical protein